MINLPIKIIDERLKRPDYEPDYGHHMSATFDVRAVIDKKVSIPRHGERWIGFGFRASMPDVMTAIIVPRGLIIDDGGNVIQPYFRGEWGANFKNLTGGVVVIEPMQIIASVMLLPSIQAEICPCDSIDDDTTTDWVDEGAA